MFLAFVWAADFSKFCAALTAATDEGFAQAQADLDRQRGKAADLVLVVRIT